MIAERTLSYFDSYFPILFKLGFTIFQWDPKKRVFIFSQNRLHELIAWWVGLILLFVKEIFLLRQFIQVLVPQKALGPMVFQWIFLMSYWAGIGTNVLFWKYRRHVPELFSGSAHFSREAHAKYLPEVKAPYPLLNDGLVPNIRMGMCLIFLFPCSIFSLSIASPQLPMFFSATATVPITNWLYRVPLSLLEAYIGMYAWAANIVVITYIPNLVQLLAFWVAQLGQRNKWSTGNVVGTEDEERNHLSSLVNTYRQLQLLTINLNEVFATQTFNIFVPAFFNQVAVNYGTIRLYEQLSLASWAFCPYLSFSGGANLFMVQTLLAAPYEASVVTLQSWKQKSKIGYMRRRIKSCPPIKIMYSSYRHFQNDTAPQYFDSLIDSTVTLLLWK